MATGAREGRRRSFVAALVAVAAIVAVVAGLALGNALGRTGPDQGGSTLTGASSPSPTGVGSVASEMLSPTPTAPPTPVPTPKLVPAPLTGLQVTPEAAAQHPIAVMVDDHRDARPQSGFNAASVVWHAPAEGGIPRYMLVFQETIPASIGPIRSSRQYFIDWASEWNAIYVHVGGSPQALATLRAKGAGQLVWNVDEIELGARAVWRVRGKVAPHNAYSDGEHLRAVGTAIGALDEPMEPAWSFAPELPLDARGQSSVITVTYPYERVTYRYDRSSNVYRRFIDGSSQPQVDAADGLAVGPRNVVILRMRFGLLNDSQPEKGRLEAADVGTGEAWIATNGRTMKATWKKDSASSPTQLLWPDGRAVELTAGQTFVQVLPLSYDLSIDDGFTPAEGTLRASGE